VNQGEIVGLLVLTVPEKQLHFMIVGLVKPNWNIFLDDLNITDYPMYKRAQQGIGYLAQEACFRKLSIEDNILRTNDQTFQSRTSRKNGKSN
jgi:lipopolysaccharide export system ATP-binding protein